MSFKQKSSPLKQGFVNGFNNINNAVSGLNANRIINNGMTAAQIAYSNTPAGQAVNNPTSVASNFNSPEPVGNATAQFGANSWVTQGQQAAATVTPTVTPTASSAATVKQRGKNWFGATPTNTVDGGPQSVMQGGHGVGFRRRDSHNTTYLDRTNRGSMFDNTIGNTPTPFTQLKKEQMEYNKISPKAFSNAGTIEKMMGKSIPNSPFMQIVDPNLMPPPVNTTDPNIQAQAENVMAQTGVPLQPPTGVQTPIAPTYDLNNQ